MGDLTPNFSRSEFACKCGECVEEDISLDLVGVCQATRDHFGQPVTISSGVRCPAHNASVGGAESSRHTYPFYDAADIKVANVHPHDVYEYLDAHSGSLGVGGLSEYSSWVHVDTRPNRARW
jgi:uncharacterized protein YcbK (DUF882 family)